MTIIGVVAAVTWFRNQRCGSWAVDGAFRLHIVIRRRDRRSLMTSQIVGSSPTMTGKER